MSWISIIWYMSAASAMTVAGIQLIVWYFSRESKSSLWFVIAACSASLMAFLELSLMQAKSPDAYAEILRWMHLTVALLVISIIWFIRSYLTEGRYWLAWTVVGLRLIILIVNFLFYPNATFAEVTSLKHMEFLGEVFSIPIGQENPWRLLIKISSLLFFIYILDASISAWKHGKKREALVFGSALLIAILASATISHFMVAGKLPGPFITITFMIILLAMSFELAISLVQAKSVLLDFRRSQKSIALAIEAANLSLWEWNIPKDKLTILGTSPGLSDIRLPKQGNLDTYLKFIYPDDREQFRRSMMQAQVDGEYRSESRVVGPDGKTRWFSAYGATEYDMKDEPLVLRGVFKDITAQKNADIKLERSRRELMHFSQVMTLGQLSFSLAHEINQPLGAIMRNAEAAKLLLHKNTPDIDEINSIIKDIREDSYRAAAVIERMRETLRRQEPDFQKLAVNELINQIIKALHTEIQLRNIEVKLDLPDEMLFILGDRIQLSQVLTNLLMNGMEAYVDNYAGQRQIVIHVDNNRQNIVEISISDCGSGINEEQMRHIFDPFYTTKKEGMGIGLVISKTIIELHRGSITIENNQDGGATVKLMLPMAN